MFEGMMARRKELKNIASGLIGSFNSRNNDVDGYWALGKLYRFANACNTDTVSIELISGWIKPQTDAFQSIVAVYRAMLTAQLRARGIPIEWVAEVIFTTKFNQAYQADYHRRGSPGNPYICECEIIDDRARVHKAVAGNSCWPHDPKKERCSTRARE